MRLVRVLAAGAAVALASAAAAHALTPLPQSVCTRIVAGGRAPQVLIASDLPVRAFAFRAKTLQMEAAIRFVLARHGFRAGKFTVGYQACDDSNAEQGAGDLTRCSANAKLYAANRAVIAVIGTWSSRCSQAELPILDTAPGGPLALVSPSNTNVGLTHAAAGAAPGEPDRYYPAHVRDFVRVISPDDAQGRAEALLAERIGARSVFVLNDGSGYGLGVAEAFTAEAHRLGLAIVGSAAWSPGQTHFASLARKVRTSRAGGVFLAGVGCPACGQLIRGLRSAVGRTGAIIAGDGFTPVAGTAKSAGTAAEGMYVGVPGATPAQFSPLGREIARRFGGIRLGSGGPAYAAETAEIVLDALARSDGSRASVTRAISATRLPGGIIGSIGFDRNGDPIENPVLIFRVVHGRGVLDRVLLAPA